MEKATRNQLGNLSNRYQTEAKRVLCVCSAGLLRSPTVANVLYQDFGYNCRSAGASDFALVKLSEALILWADEIVCVEAEVVDYFSVEAFNLAKEKLVTLSLPDQFSWNDPELIESIRKQYAFYVLKED